MHTAARYMKLFANHASATAMCNGFFLRCRTPPFNTTAYRPVGSVHQYLVVMSLFGIYAV